MLRIYRAESSKDPTSRAMESSRSNVIAVQHTVRQIYGEALRGLILREFGLRSPAFSLSGQANDVSIGPSQNRSRTTREVGQVQTEE